MARPNKYDQSVKDKLAAVQGWARNGLTNEQIAKNLGINIATLYKYKANYKELNEALKKGREVVDFEVENALLKRALGFRYKETTRELCTDAVTGEEEIKVTKIVEKEVAPDVGAAAFWLKNRKPTEWRDRREIGTELQGDGSITFNIMPASQRPEETEESEG